ncbi:hypothetical protein D3C81_1894590 [compost metagenome]
MTRHTRNLYHMTAALLAEKGQDCTRCTQGAKHIGHKLMFNLPVACFFHCAIQAIGCIIDKHIDRAQF